MEYISNRRYDIRKQKPGPASQGLAGAPRPSAEAGDSRSQVGVRLGQPQQELLELAVAEVAGLESVHPCPADGARRDEAVALEALKRSLDARQRQGEEPGQLARIALREEAQREEHAGSRLASERARVLDYHDL